MGMLGELQQSEPRLDRVRRGCASFCDALRRRTPLLVIWALYVLFMGLTPYYFGSQLLGVCFWLREAGIFGVVIFVAFLACWVACFLPELPLYILGGFIWGFFGGFAAGLLGSAGAGMMTYHLVDCLRRKEVFPSTWARRLNERYVEIRMSARLVAKKPYRGLMLIRLLYIATPVMNYGICIALAPPLPPFVVTQSISAFVSQMPNAYIGSTARNLHDAWQKAKGEADHSDATDDERMRQALFEVLPRTALLGLFLVAVAIVLELIRRQLVKEAEAEAASPESAAGRLASREDLEEAATAGDADLAPSPLALPPLTPSLPPDGAQTSPFSKSPGKRGGSRTPSDTSPGNFNGLAPVAESPSQRAGQPAPAAPAEPPARAVSGAGQPIGQPAEPQSAGPRAGHQPSGNLAGHVQLTAQPALSV